MGKARRFIWNAALAFSSGWIRFGYTMHGWARKLDTSPPMDIEELIGGVEPIKTPFGEIMVHKDGSG